MGYGKRAKEDKILMKKLGSSVPMSTHFPTAAVTSELRFPRELSVPRGALPCVHVQGEVTAERCPCKCFFEA